MSVSVSGSNNVRCEPNGSWESRQGPLVCLWGLMLGWCCLGHVLKGLEVIEMDIELLPGVLYVVGGFASGPDNLVWPFQGL